MTPSSDDYLTWLGEQLGYSTWESATAAAMWRSWQRWFGILVGLVLVFLPLGYLLGMVF
jgi:hypothetical protein